MGRVVVVAVPALQGSYGGRDRWASTIFGEVESRSCKLTMGKNPMTSDSMQPFELLEKAGTDDQARERSGFIGQRMMELDVEGRCTRKTVESWGPSGARQGCRPTPAVRRFSF